MKWSDPDSVNGWNISSIMARCVCFGESTVPTWRHSCSSWALRSELPAVTVHTDKPPGPPRWASGLSFRSLCCGWWTRPSEPAAETAADAQVNLCDRYNVIQKTFTEGRLCRCNVSQKSYFSSRDLRPQLCTDWLLARQHRRLFLYFWKLQHSHDGALSNPTFSFSLRLVSKRLKYISLQTFSEI